MPITLIAPYPMLARTTIGQPAPPGQGPSSRPDLPPLPVAEGFSHSWLTLPTDVEVHVAQAGPATGRPVLALHGWPQHWYMWRTLERPLADGGFRLICPDLRGLGWSAWPRDGDFAKARLAEDVLALLDALGIREAAVIGHDWGGWVGFVLARAAPRRVSRLMALGIVAPWNRGARAGLRDLAFAYQPLMATPWLGPRMARSRRAMATLMDRATGRDFEWYGRDLAAYLDVLAAPRVAEASSRLYRSFLAREVHRTRTVADGADGVIAPVLQMVGEQDLVRIRLDRAGPPPGPDWTVERVPRCGHFIVDERPGLVAARALSFLTTA